MIGALKWLTHINPIRYGFENLVANEFHTINGTCVNVVPAGPGYDNVPLENKVCTTVGSVPGQTTVDGNTFIKLSYGYSYSHVWRNFGIVVGMYMFFLSWFLFATERSNRQEGKNGGTVLVYKQGANVDVNAVTSAAASSGDEEKVIPGRETKHAGERGEEELKKDQEDAMKELPVAKNFFSWQHLNYDITLPNGSTRRLLDDVSGYVAPGRLTALMGESGAGKTTLLNTLAQRTDAGVITGDMFIDGRTVPRDFQAQTGYCQQMDIHLESTTIREALLFSAILRQPASVPLAEKKAYVEEVLKMCAMESYADAVVGKVGQGLNVEQRKRLTIGVELAAKPRYLLFLDEPTSGLDSQSAWAIVSFLRELADKGQAILCTIHQPSAELFQVFDRLLLLRKGGQTVYFGDLGRKSQTMIDYFERNGGRPCSSDENPAEYILDVIGAGATASTSVNWNDVWKSAPESKRLEQEIERIHSEKRNAPVEDDGHHPEFASSFITQLSTLLVRSFRDYIRKPSYLMAKFMTCIAFGLFIGFTFFKAPLSFQGSQNHLFAVFMSLILSVPISNQLQVQFIIFRNIWEQRERPSKMYNWWALVANSVLVEIPFNIFGLTLMFLCWYWTVGFPDESNRVGYHFLMYCVLFPLYFATFAQATAALSPNAEIAGLLFSFLFNFCFVFNGVLQPYSHLVEFWHWMYRLNPFTYLVEGLVSNGVASLPLTCSDTELAHITPPSGLSCQQYLGPFIQATGGYLTNPDATSDCLFCSASQTDSYLVTLNMSYSHRWRNAGFMVAYVIFNVFLVFSITYLVRVRGVSGLKKLFSRRRA
jgi:ATP-binding cassette subfamily G (WHITE) protein 2 (SNQ2)